MQKHENGQRQRGSSNENVQHSRNIGLDYSARIQTVHKDTNPRYYELLKAFDQLTGCGVVVNASFNVRGEPIVCTPTDAYRCFMRTEMDYLVVENFFLDKKEQPALEDDTCWQDEFELD